MNEEKIEIITYVLNKLIKIQKKWDEGMPIDIRNILDLRFKLQKKLKELL